MNQKGFTSILFLIGLLIVGLVGISILYFTVYLNFKTIPINNYHLNPSSTTQEVPTKYLVTTTLADKLSVKNSSTPIQKPIAAVTEKTNTEQKIIHLYPYYGVNPKQSINNLNIIGIMFRPKNIDTTVKPEWTTNMDKIFGEIKQFFEQQFRNYVSISYQVVDDAFTGEKNIEDYYPWELAVEVKNKRQSLFKSGAYNVFMIYLIRDSKFEKNVKGGTLGGLANYQAATQYEFWLDYDALNPKEPYGIKASAHEFGHALGIPHPWDLPVNTGKDKNSVNLRGDLMGDNYSGLQLKDLYIRDDVKKEMGL